MKSFWLRGAALALALAGLATPVPALAAPAEPAVPLAVAPGVPGNGRAWELTTPPETIGAVLIALNAISADGNRISYETIGQLPASPLQEPLIGTNISTRGRDGWVSEPVFPPTPEGGSLGLFPSARAAAPDLVTGIWENESPSYEVSLFARAADGSYTPLAEDVAFIDASADLQHALFLSPKHLVAADAARTGRWSLYESVGSVLRLVNVDGAGSLLSPCGVDGGNVPGAISPDGELIFFGATTPSCYPNNVYLRAGGATTTEISASQCDLPDCGPEGNSFLVGATPSGSSAFLISEERLTDDDSNPRDDLYRYDVADGDLTLISADLGPGLTPKKEPVQVSADGSRVYFVATEQGEITGVRPKIYLAAEGEVRPLPGADRLADLRMNELLQLADDGRYAVYLTPTAVDAADTDEQLDIYRYDTRSGAAIRISAGPTGGNGPFDTSVSGLGTPDLIPVTHPYRFASEDGSRIFFSTEERLLPQDRNEARDVYEWAGGRLALISAGSGTADSVYAHSTPDGKSVVFETPEPLLPSDRDGGDWDFYVARIGGGFAETSPPAGCAAGSCPAPRGRLDRAVPNSAKPGGARRIRLRPIGAAERRGIAESGWITLLAEVPRAGRLTAEARALIGSRPVRIASGRVRVEQAGPVRLRLRLSARARARLAAGHGLRVRLTLRLSGLDSVRRTGFQLGGRR